MAQSPHRNRAMGSSCRSDEVIERGKSPYREPLMPRSCGPDALIVRPSSATDTAAVTGPSHGGQDVVLRGKTNPEQSSDPRRVAVYAR
jgi:hypothetical protein